MADNKDQEQNKKKTGRATKISYIRCIVCGGRKKETDLMNVGRNICGPSSLCEECFKKQSHSDCRKFGGKKWTK